MDYRNLAEEELKLRIAEQFFPTCDCAYRIGKIDFTGGPTRTAVRATSGQRGDHTGGAGDERIRDNQERHVIRCGVLRADGPCGRQAVRREGWGVGDKRAGGAHGKNGRITLRSYENHSVEKGYRVGAAVLRGRRCGVLRADGPCGRRAGKGEITPAARALHAAPLRKPRGRITLRPYK